MPQAAKLQIPPKGLRLHVCPLERLHEITHSAGATHVVSLINQQNMPATPARVPEAHHLRLAINDIASPMDGMVHPAPEHIASLLEFADRWGAQSPLVIHCWAGISRSTAAAFITLCALNPKASEMAIAKALRAASPTAQPNTLMVGLADEALDRRGRMIDAIERLSDAQMSEASPFWLPLRY